MPGSVPSSSRPVRTGEGAATRWLLALLLAVCTTAPACGPGGSTPTPSRSGELTSEDGLRVTLTPGTAREKNAEAPLLWASIPSPRLVIESGADDPASRSFRIGNIASESAPEIREARYLSADAVDGCGETEGRTVDCDSDEDPICRSFSFSHGFGSSTEAILRVDLPACRRLRLELQWTVDRSQSFRVAALGPEVPADEIGRRVDRAAQRANLVLLTGDHPADSEEAAIREVERRLRSREAPIVYAPGEVENLRGSTSAFQTSFGPPDVAFTVGSIQFVTVPSSLQTLGEGGVGELRARMRTLERDEPVVALTHTPPFDPEQARGLGFRSQIEAARTLSSLSTYRTDLLVAGHLPEAHRQSYDAVEFAVPPSGAAGGYQLFELTPRTAGAGSKLDVETAIRGR